MYKPRQSSNWASCDQDASDPNTCSNLVKDEIARDLKQEVAPEENSGGESELLARDRQFAIHSQRRKPQVDSVNESNDIERKEERQQSDPEFPDRCRFDWV